MKANFASFVESLSMDNFFAYRRILQNKNSIFKRRMDDEMPQMQQSHAGRFFADAEDRRI